MKKTILVFAFGLCAVTLFAQKKTTTSATISFDASTSLDPLPKAENKTSVASLDTKTGKIAFEAMIKNFSFSNPMMQEHYNSEKWMDSEKYPTAVFKGAITNLDAINFEKDGTYTANVEGNLTFHGETKEVKAPAAITIKGKEINTTSEFTVKLDDYKISGGPVTAGKVSKEPKISVIAEFK